MKFAVVMACMICAIDMACRALAIPLNAIVPLWIDWACAGYWAVMGLVMATSCRVEMD